MNRMAMLRNLERAVGGLLAAACAFLVVVTVGGGVRSWILLRPAPALQVGQLAPSVTLSVADQPGFVVDTGRLRGRPVLLTRWNESCTDCADSLRLANQYQEEFSHTGFLAVVVSEGSYLAVLRNREYAQRLAPSVMRLEDVDGLVRHGFPSDPPPRWILIGASGKVVGFGSSPGPSRDMVVASATL
jgi:hypothetical protein